MVGGGRRCLSENLSHTEVCEFLFVWTNTCSNASYYFLYVVCIFSCSPTFTKFDGRFETLLHAIKFQSLNLVFILFYFLLLSNLFFGIHADIFFNFTHIKKYTMYTNLNITHTISYFISVHTAYIRNSLINMRKKMKYIYLISAKFFMK